MKIYKSKLVAGKFSFPVAVNKVKLELSHCDLSCGFVLWGNMYLPSMGPEHQHSLDFHIDHGSVSGSYVEVTLAGTIDVNIRVINVSMFNVRLINDDQDNKSNLVVHVENTTWVNENQPFMELYSILSVCIVSSKMTGTCLACTLIDVHGQMHSSIRSSVSFIATNFKAQGDVLDLIKTKAV